MGPLEFTAVTERYQPEFTQQGEFLRFKEWTRHLPTPATVKLASRNITTINMPFQSFAGDGFDALYLSPNITDVDRLFVNTSIHVCVCVCVCALYPVIDAVVLTRTASTHAAVEK